MEDNTTKGDWYAPVDEKPKKSKFAIVATVIIVLSLAALSYWYYNSGGGTGQKEVTEAPPVVTQTKTPDQVEAERLQKAQRAEIDKMRALYQAQKTSQPAPTTQVQSQALDTLRNESVTQQTTTTTAPKTSEQQKQELDALRAAAKK